MKNILNLNKIVFGDGTTLKFDMPPLETDESTIRIPVIFVVDRSGTMAPSLQIINHTLTDFCRRITTFHVNRKLASVIDIAIIAFDTRVEIVREFGLLKKNEKFEIERCAGMTALGEAMLTAYKYGQDRKLQYKEKGFDYRQPMVVLLTDFQDNPLYASSTVNIDGTEYKVADLYNQMCELYTERMNATPRATQYTCAVPMGQINQDALNKLNRVKILKNDNGENMPLEQSLDAVLKLYTASVKHELGKKELGLMEIDIISTTTDLNKNNHEPNPNKLKNNDSETDPNKPVPDITEDRYGKDIQSLIESLFEDSL